MLTAEGEEILRLQKSTTHSFLVISTNQGKFLHINGNVLGTDSDSNRKYVNAVDDLMDEGLVKQVGEHAFNLTTHGQAMADALIEEEKIMKMVPDSCTIFARGTPYNVTFLGADRSDGDDNERDVLKHIVQLGGKVHIGHAGVFHISQGDMEKDIYVILNGPSIPKVGLIKGKNTISRATLEILLKRPGCRVVRECLSNEIVDDKNSILEYPKFPDTESINSLESIEGYIDILDDPRPKILDDCERDVLEILIADRENRKPVGTTSADIAASPKKRRFYDIKRHIRETLVDLNYKELIRTDDDIHYQIEVRRLIDARRVAAGLRSDDLFDAPPPAKLAAYIPESTKEFDAFLCHASEDRQSIVRPFAQAMNESGLKPWIDEKQLGWGDNLVARIQEGLTRSRFVVVFLSEAFLGKKWPDTELNTALSMEIGGRTLVLPILLGLTHQTLQAMYPLVSAKVYKEVANYNREKTLCTYELKSLIDELRNLIEDS
jgi:hypothetical protein